MNDTAPIHRDPIADKLPGVDFHYDILIASDIARHSELDAFEIAKREGAMKLADMIVRNPKFFVTEKSERGDTVIRITADAFVLTRDELLGALTAAYAKGEQMGRFGR